MNRASSTACSHDARTSDGAVVRADAPPPSVLRGAARCQSSVRAVSFSEYGPVGGARASTIAPDYLTSARVDRYLRPCGSPTHVSLRSRERKLRLFLDELHPTAETPVLDVGADELGFGEGDGCGTLNFFEEHYPWPERITALGLHDGARFRDALPAHPLRPGRRAARCRSRTASSTSCSRTPSSSTSATASGSGSSCPEALRVGRRAFITTPNRRFPIEVHTRLPLVHWLPDPTRARVVRRAREGAGRRRSISSRGGAFESLFPGRVRIVNLGLTLVAIVD